MAKRISERTHTEVVTFHLYFEDRGMPGAGFAFPCDKDGNLADGISECGRNNYAKLANGEWTDRYHEPEIQRSVNRYTEPAIIQCECCERHVPLSGFTNGCMCGAMYNMSGQMLADPSFWGEETGESAADILMADTDRDWA